MAPWSWRAESSLPREKGIQNIQSMLLAKLFAQQTPAWLVTSGKRSVKEEMV